MGKLLVWLWVALGGVTLLAGAASMLFPPGCSQRASNERNAGASLKTIASAQADYRDHDRDGNKVGDYWRGDVSGLYGLRAPGSTDMIKLIEVSVAAADGAALKTPAPGRDARDSYAVFAPKAGYFFRALTHADEDPAAPDPKRFAACAYPAVYPQSGSKTFVISQDGVIYRRDLKGRFPAVFPDPETLKREWAELD